MKLRCQTFNEFINESFESPDFQYMFFTKNDEIGFGIGHDENDGEIKVQRIGGDSNMLWISDSSVLHQYDELANKIGKTADRVTGKMGHFTVLKGTKTLTNKTIENTSVLLGIKIDPKKTIEVGQLAVKSDVPISDVFLFSDLYENLKVRNEPWFKVLKNEIQRESGITIDDDNKVSTYQIIFKINFGPKENIDARGIAENILRETGVVEMSEPKERVVSLTVAGQRKYEITFNLRSESDVRTIHREIEIKFRTAGARLVFASDPKIEKTVMTVTDVFKLAESLGFDVKTFADDYSGDIYMHTAF